MKSYWYDLEVFPNMFLAVFVDTDTPQHLIDVYVAADIADDKTAMADAMELINPIIFLVMYDDERIVDQLDDLLLFVDNPDVMLIGFNNEEYDNILLNYGIIKKRRLGTHIGTIKMLKELYDINIDIIDSGYMTAIYNPIFKGYRARYMSIDTYKSLYETVHRKSLKQTMINLKWYNVLDLPIKPGTHITWSMLDDLTYYCINDVLGTRAFYVYNTKEINMKKAATMLYGVMLINKNRSSMADALLQKMYSERTGLTYWQLKDLRTFRTTIKLAPILDNRIHFEAPVFQAYLDKLKASTMIAGESKLLNAGLPFMGNRYDIAKGGLHSKDMPGVYKSTEKYAIMDGDVDSYYPNGVVNDKICPAHLFQPIFTSIGEYLVNDRMSAKATKRAGIGTKEEIERAGTIADVLKIVLNSGIFGKFGYEKGWLYDLLAMYQVTINNQLRLLKWVEMLEFNGFQVLSVNTDGITVKVERSRMEEYKNISIEWGKMFGFTLEFNEYDLYVRLNVNSYFAVYTNGKVKTKGRFLTNIALEKGYDKPIVAKALIEHFRFGTDIMSFLKKHDDIYDFCMSQKLGADYNPMFHELITSEHVITPLQKNIRYYVCATGGRIMKEKGKKQISVLREQVVIFNKFIKYSDISRYNIDYSYYRREIMKLVDLIEHRTTKIMKKVSGTMFDELDEF